MPFSVKDLNLPSDKQAQLNKALGGKPDDEAASRLQAICDGAAADVARLTTGYTIDGVSISNFIRAIALKRAYGDGPAPKTIEDNHDSAWKELTEISQGKRPNLPHAAAPDPEVNGIGTWGGKTNIPGIRS